MASQTRAFTASSVAARPSRASVKVYASGPTANARVNKFSKSDIIVAPSILSANFAKLGEQVGLDAASWGPRLPVWGGASAGQRILARRRCPLALCTRGQAGPAVLGGPCGKACRRA